MRWTICLFLSLAVFLCGAGKALLLRGAKNKGRRFLNPVNTLVISSFLAATVMFFPIYHEIFAEDPLRILKTFLLSVHNAIRLFIVDGEFTIILEHAPGTAAWIAEFYSIYAAILFVTAPILTFGVVLLFFKNMSAYRRYFLGFFKDVYVFSELNDRSYVLAESIRKSKKHALLLFTDVFESNEESSYELIEKARELSAVCFKKDILNINFKFHSKGSALSFFAIGENESENIDQALKLIADYRNRAGTNLYVFAGSADSELLLQSAEKGKVLVRRINDIRSLINRTLYDKGHRIFETARRSGDVREINAVVVGLGRYGSCMVKALSWFCQMDGYKLTVHAFDRDPWAAKKFTAQCPELMSPQYNGVRIPGEAEYSITVHPGLPAETDDFAKAIGDLPGATYLFVALGNDEDNLRTATWLRMLYERMGSHPLIQTVIFNAAQKEALQDIENYRGQKYDIDFIGDLKSSYSAEVILSSELESEALARHLRWGGEEEFWKFEYNYRSSVASAIHKKMKLQCGIPGIEKAVADRTVEELWALRRLEHRRWNAYMRSEGYCYGSVRNDLARTHPCLVPFDMLSEKDQEKDDD